MTNSTNEDPVLPHYREWLAARTEFLHYANIPFSGAETDAASDREEEALRAMLDVTPTTLAGVAAVAHLLWDLVGPTGLRGGEWLEEECGRTENQLLASLWRAGGNSGLPSVGEA